MSDSSTDYDEEPMNPIKGKKELGEVKIQKRGIPKLGNAIIVCVSSSALFDMTVERKFFKKNGLKAYLDYIIKKEDTPLKPGSAFPFVQALNLVNEKLLELDPKEKMLFDVVLMSNNNPQVGVALFNSINHHDLTVERTSLTNGNSVIGYLKAYKADLYLSVDVNSVIEALSQGIASAVLSAVSKTGSSNKLLRVVYDGDAVLFSDEAAITAKKKSLNKFYEHEAELADKPLDDGPLRQFASTLGKIKNKFQDQGKDCPIKTYLVTARSGASSGIRALKTLRVWGLEIDETHFLAGAPKGPILEIIQPHIFFDDKQGNVDSGIKHGVPSAHVPKSRNCPCTSAL